jgi:hypothetical protein
MKKKYLLRFFVIITWSVLLTALITRVYLSAGVPVTHDGENHLARFANYKVALREGQLPPRFAPNLYHRLGYPVFNYNYPLANILSVPFSLIKLSYPLIFKILMTASLIGAVSGLWVWLTQYKMGLVPKLLATTAFITSPYIFQSVIYRGSIGEIMATALLVWILVWIEYLRTVQTNSKITVLRDQLIFSFPTIVGVLLFATFFLSHNVMVLFGTPVLTLYALWRLGVTQKLTSFICSIILGICLSLWFWLPALLEQSAVVVGSSSLSQQYQSHFPTFQQLLSTQLQFGFSYLGSIDSFSYALGIGQWFILVCSLGLLVATLKKGGLKAVQKNPAPAYMFGATALSLFLQLQITQDIWQAIPVARFIQFPWRLGLFSAIGITFLTAWVVKEHIRWQIGLLVIFFIFQAFTLLKLQPVGYVNKERVEYELFDQSTTTSNENLPKDFTLTEFPNWSPAPSIENGTASASVKFWTGTRRSYSINATTPVTVIEPTMYFPGWRTTAVQSGENVEQTLEYINSETIKGRIAYQLEPGNYTITTTFTESTTPRLIGDAVSIFTLLLISLHLVCLRLFYGKN